MKLATVTSTRVCLTKKQAKKSRLDDGCVPSTQHPPSEKKKSRPHPQMEFFSSSFRGENGHAKHYKLVLLSGGEKP